VKHEIKKIKNKEGTPDDRNGNESRPEKEIKLGIRK